MHQFKSTDIKIDGVIYFSFLSSLSLINMKNHKDLSGKLFTISHLTIIAIDIHTVFTL